MPAKVKEGRDYRILPDNYRKIFHKHNKPCKVVRKKINGKMVEIPYYRCIYCGKLVELKDMQVDHIIPKTRLMAGILWNPNKAWNLGASCAKCNISKSNYINGRVLKGFKNKIINKYSLRRRFADARCRDINLKDNTNTVTGDNKSTQNIMLVVVLLLTLCTPVIIILSWLLQIIMFILTRLVNFLKKKFKKILKHPNKLIKLLNNMFIILIIFLIVALIKSNCSNDILSPISSLFN